jgi:ribonuclease-3
VIAEFCRHFGLEFHRPELVKLALTHRSYLTVSGQGPRESNERLEFLGDSVLGLVTSEFLYQAHPNEHEGQLTKTKSLLVSKAILSRRALGMGLGRFVLMSHSEIESGGRQRLSILADAFEAVVGAIYLDQGFEAARAFIARWLLRDTGEIVADKRHTNFKSHLQEYVQSTYRTHPIYRIRSEMGPDHSKQFNVEVLVGKRVLGTGRGRNKKEAEQAAARNALEQVESTNIARRGETPEAPTRPAPRGERPRPPERAAAVAPQAAPPAPEVEEGESDRSRRRGRRGGRGRSRREEPGSAPEAVAAPRPERSEAVGRTLEPRRAAPASRPAPPPRSVPSPGPVPPSAVVDAQPSLGEFEETPPFEDDLEEIGRPEGPPGDAAFDRHIDRFEAIPASTAPSPPRPPSRESREPLDRDPMFGEAPESEGPPAAKPDEPHPPRKADSRPSYGRRTSRGRRG